MRILRIEALALVLLLLAAPVMATSTPPSPGEDLEYTLRFRGWVTGFIELNVAKLTLSVEPELQDVEGTPAYVTRLRLTTEPFSKAELLYPVRLDYRSWLDARLLEPILATKSLHTDDAERELFWFDRTARTGYRYASGPGDEAQGDPAPPPSRLQPITALPETTWSSLRARGQMDFEESGVLDYMGLLQQLRYRPLQPGEWYDFRVFTGKKLEHYRVQVAKERLVRAGWDRPAYHLKLFEFDPKKQRLKDEINLWLSDDPQRVLLRFYAERTIGALEGILETGRPENGRHEKLQESTRRSLETYLGF